MAPSVPVRRADGTVLGDAAGTPLRDKGLRPVRVTAEAPWRSRADRRRAGVGGLSPGPNVRYAVPAPAMCHSMASRAGPAGTGRVARMGTPRRSRPGPLRPARATPPDATHQGPAVLEQGVEA